MKNLSPKTLQILGLLVSGVSAVLTIVGGVIANKQQNLDIQEQVAKALAEQASK